MKTFWPWEPILRSYLSLWHRLDTISQTEISVVFVLETGNHNPPLHYGGPHLRPCDYHLYRGNGVRNTWSDASLVRRKWLRLTYKNTDILRVFSTKEVLGTTLGKWGSSAVGIVLGLRSVILFNKVKGGRKLEKRGSTWPLVKERKLWELVG